MGVEWILALRYLRSSRGRFLGSTATVLSIAGIAIGVAALITVMSVMNGFAAKLLESILGINGHITVHCEGLHCEEAVSTIRDISGVVTAASVTESQAMLKSGNKVMGAIVRGMDVQDFKNKKALSECIVRGDVEEFKQGLIVGARLAEGLGIDYGDEVMVISPGSFFTVIGPVPRVKNYRVVGVFDVGMYEYDSGFVYMPIQEADLFFGRDSVTRYIEVFLKDLQRSAEMLQLIKKRVNLRAEDWKTQQGHYVRALEMENNAMFLILTLIVMVAAFNIVSSLSVLVRDKKRAIAIMRTVGLSRCSIMQIFCICGTLTGVIGTMIGCVVGILLSFNVENIRSFFEKIVGNSFLDPVVYLFDSIPSEIMMGDVIRIVVLSVGISFVATIPPAMRAAYQNPVDVLRYE